MLDLPRGTVTFLFTDIEGSTRLWERDPAAMGQALERHNAILDAAITAHDGIHFKTIGDAFQAAFPDASAAIAAVVDAQRALHAEPWAATGPIRVRMAIHVGEAIPSGGDRPDYLSPALNSLGRLLATGHGGQTLLSNAARILATDTLPDGVALRDLGRHQLRDQLDLEQIWQLVIPGLPDDFPPLKTLDRNPTNLPRPPTSLVGRDALLAELLPILTDPATRLLTLTGPGGVGKTRLAIQLAVKGSESFPDGAFFVDLATVTHPAAVLPLVASALGVREGGGLSLKEATIALLAQKRLLLVLDNLEQIRPVDALSREISELVGAAPSLTILATSRAPQQIRAEREWPVEPLAVPDPARLLPPPVLAENPAVALFLERAQAAKPSFALTDTNAAAVAEIVHLLDGLPLALELAAARLRALSANQLRDRLGKQIDLLFGGTRDRPDRHQTLRATIQWSHDLLSPEQQAFFRRLAVFAGGFSLDAAEAVIGEVSDPLLDALDGVAELLNESLVRAEETVDGDLRYRMLETIRAYAIERLETSGEESAARAAHLGYYSRWSEATATGLKDLDRPSSLDRFQTELANIHAALEWACAAGRKTDGLTLAGHVWKFWQFRAHFSEGRSWLQRLLEATPDEPTADRAVGFEAAGVLAWNQGDLPAAEALLERALAINLERGDEVGRGRCLNNLGNVHNLMGNLDSAAALFQESLELARSMGNSRQEATLLNNLALIEMDRGALDEAQTLLEESLALKQRLGVRSETSIVLGNLALIAWLRRDLGLATELLEEGLEIERETGNPVGIADALGNLAQVLVETGELARAVTLHRESLILRHDIGDWLSIPYSLESIAAAAVGTGIVAPAVRLLAASDALRQATAAPIQPTDRPGYEDVIGQAKVQLREDRFAAIWCEGQLLGRDAAVEAALALCDAIDARQGSASQSLEAPAIEMASRTAGPVA